MIKVKKIKLDDSKNNSKKEKKEVEYEIVNGILLRKDRLSTVLTVDGNANVIAISGENPKKTKIGKNLYE